MRYAGRSTGERAVLATIDFAMAAEAQSFDTSELQENVARVLKRSSANM